jgi:hypothetical protein
VESVPISKYYRGSGKKVMANMKREYGDKEGERVFYAVANTKKSMKPKGKKKSSK